jgi:hypothetical protein
MRADEKSAADKIASPEAQLQERVVTKRNDPDTLGPGSAID